MTFPTPGYCNCAHPEPALVNNGMSAICEKCGAPIAPSAVPSLLVAAQAILKFVDVDHMRYAARAARPSAVHGPDIPWLMLADMRRAVDAAIATTPPPAYLERIVYNQYYIAVALQNLARMPWDARTDNRQGALNACMEVVVDTEKFLNSVSGAKVGSAASRDEEANTTVGARPITAVAPITALANHIIAMCGWAEILAENQGWTRGSAASFWSARDAARAVARKILEAPQT